MALERQKQEYRELSKKLWEENQKNELLGKNGIVFSRACRGCSNESPIDRFFSSACGHAICRACAGDATSCPICFKSTSFVKLFEDSSSRECAICFCDAPVQRSVFTACGHIICRACMTKMRLDYLNNWKKPCICPFCAEEKQLKPGTMIEMMLIEERVETIDDLKTSKLTYVFALTCFPVMGAFAYFVGRKLLA